MEKKIITPTSSNGKKINLLIAFHLVLFLIVIFYLLPTDDDWGYLVAPKLEGFNFNSFLPNDSQSYCKEALRLYPWSTDSARYAYFPNSDQFLQHFYS